MPTWDYSCSRANRQANLSFRKLFHQFDICFKKIELRQLRRVRPLHIAKNAVLDFTCELPHQKEVQFKSRPAAVSVANGGQASTNFRQNAKLFFEFAIKRGPFFFSRLDLTSRELPFERHGLVPGALADQNFVICNDQSCDDFLH